MKNQQLPSLHRSGILMLLLLLVSVSGLKAQLPSAPAAAPSSAPSNQTYAQQAEYVLGPLDKSQVTTGILYDAVFSASDLDAYSGTNGSLATSAFHFFQAYWEMYNSAFQKGGMKTPDELENQIESFNPDPSFHHPMGILQFQFNKLRDDAESANLIQMQQDGRFYDVAGRPSSPYNTVTSFLATPLFPDNSSLFSGSHYFHVDSRFVLSNTGLGFNSIQSVSINYNGAVTTQSPGTPLQVNLQYSSQPQTMTVTVTLTNGVAYLLPVILPDVVPYSPSTSTCDGKEKVTVFGDYFDGGYGTGGYSAQGDAYIYFSNQSCGDKKLRKPIVFLDGFDPDNSRDHVKIYNEYINKQFSDNSTLTRLGDELRANGYDIVVFDYNKQGQKSNRGGAGYIENNGLAVAKLLTTLYNTHSATMQEDFIVIGPSMGSLIGQYALAHMEHNGIPHHTRLFISFDGPHKGANVSIGLQSFIDAIGQQSLLANVEALSQGLHQSNAAKQMLVDHSSVSNEAPEPHPFRNIFLQNLAAVGNYPTQCRTVAIVNGSGNGTRNTHFNPCDKLLQIAIKKLPFPNCTQDFCYKLKSDMYASTESQRCLGMSYFTKSLLTNSAFINSSGSRYTQQNNLSTSFDEAPGSGFNNNVEDMVTKKIRFLSALFIGGLQINDNRLYNDTFVPSVSAVDFIHPFGDANLSIYSDLSQYDLTKCSGRTPFDKVYIGNNNTFHVSIDAQKAGWFREEVYHLNAPSQCQTACSNPPNAPMLTASANPVASGTPVILSSSGCNNGTITWNTGLISGSLNVTPTSTTTYTATCTVGDCTSGNGSITVNVNSGCNGNGMGLTTTYYNGQDLQGNPVVNFNGNIDIIGDQSNNLPGSNVQANNVSARWEGQVEAPVNGTYNFNVQTDDGVRVWLNGQQVVDDFGYYGSTPHYFSANLSAGQKYNIKVEWKQAAAASKRGCTGITPARATRSSPPAACSPRAAAGAARPPMRPQPARIPAPSIVANPVPSPPQAARARSTGAMARVVVHLSASAPAARRLTQLRAR